MASSTESEYREMDGSTSFEAMAAGCYLPCFEIPKSLGISVILVRPNSHSLCEVLETIRRSPGESTFTINCTHLLPRPLHPRKGCLGDINTLERLHIDTVKRISWPIAYSIPAGGNKASVATKEQGRG
ncbi:uncharacterized protein MCYG_03217 [Microsporum canis CBS 113480]|uniref:Uncharacterized protein n=1 Tax=Arthroderma otae (strain ATCC MYA-4605 / CBS 113480) TaxID=554155 RepID=C5FL26_ARTOC|nr:uncharacterized protein MCYG_03217 [Microsporum canis CBS 113480]EEQ30398.1 predicted protein [Microsporum canis CBS 113480]